MIQLSIALFGRELLCIQVGEPDTDTPAPDHPQLEAGSGGQFELSDFGFTTAGPACPADD